MASSLGSSEWRALLGCVQDPGRIQEWSTSTRIVAGEAETVLTITIWEGEPVPDGAPEVETIKETIIEAVAKKCPSGGGSEMWSFTGPNQSSVIATLPLRSKAER